MGKTLATFTVLKHDLIMFLVTLINECQDCTFEKDPISKISFDFCDAKRFAWLELPNCESIKQRLVHVSTMQ